MDCPDLRTAFPKYRCFRSIDHIEGQHVDPWNLELRSRHGAKLWPHGPGEVQLYVADQPVMRRRLRDAGVRVHQWGDYEATFRLTPTEAEPWLAALGFYVQRRLSEEQRAQSAARLAAARSRESTLESNGAGES